MAKRIGAESAARLAETPQGKAFLDVLNKCDGSPAVLASRIGTYQQMVRNWVYKGEIPACWAQRVAKVMRVKVGAIRPDLPPGAWVEKAPEPPKAAPEPVARTADAKLLVRVANKLGGVEEACRAIFCTVDQYRNWKSRGRIPAIKLPTVLELDQ